MQSMLANSGERLISTSLRSQAKVWKGAVLSTEGSIKEVQHFLNVLGRLEGGIAMARPRQHFKADLLIAKEHLCTGSKTGGLLIGHDVVAIAMLNQKWRRANVKIGLRIRQRAPGLESR